MSRALIEQWYNAELQQHRPQREDAGFTMGFPLWGESYVRSFLNYLLPSLLANSDALDAVNVELVLYVDRPTFAKLARLPLPLSIYLRLMSDEIANLMHNSPEWKYVLLTAVQNLLIQDAAKKGAGFGMACADVVYSSRYFERLLELGKQHDIIAMQALIVSQKDAIGKLAREDGVLSVSAPILGTFARENLVGAMKSWDLTDNENFTTMPGTHFIWWRAKHHVRLHCPHLTPVWLSPAKCKTVPAGLGETLDATALGSFYMPTRNDDMVLITLDNSRDHPADFVPFQVFKAGFQRFMYCKDQFKVACNVPTLPATEGWLPDDVIEQRFQKLCGMMGV